MSQSKQLKIMLKFYYRRIKLRITIGNNIQKSTLSHYTAQAQLRPCHRQNVSEEGLPNNTVIQ